MMKLRPIITLCSGLSSLVVTDTLLSSIGEEEFIRFPMPDYSLSLQAKSQSWELETAGHIHSQGWGETNASVLPA